MFFVFWVSTCFTYMYHSGGKVEDGENTLQAALRELEVCKALRNLTPIIDTFSSGGSWNQSPPAARR